MNTIDPRHLAAAEREAEAERQRDIAARAERLADEERQSIERKQKASDDAVRAAELRPQLEGSRRAVAESTNKRLAALRTLFDESNVHGELEAAHRALVAELRAVAPNESQADLPDPLRAIAADLATALGRNRAVTLLLALERDLETTARMVP